MLTEEECEELIKETEEIGYEPALLNVGGGNQILAPGVSLNSITFDIVWKKRLVRKIMVLLFRFSAPFCFESSFNCALHCTVCRCEIANGASWTAMRRRGGFGIG